MKARQLIKGATLGPDALSVVGKAFDEAWSAVSTHFNNPLSIEAARLILANTILANAADDSRDVDELRNHALRALILKYPQLLDAHRKSKP